MSQDRPLKDSLARRPGRDAPGRLLHAVALALLLVLAVQGQSLATLLTHWAGADHCDGAADCQPFGTGTDADGCDTPCSCLGCPAQAGALALLNDHIDLGLSSGIPAHHGPDDPLSDLLLMRSVFRPPCA
jgi:hypothetical protein